MNCNLNITKRILFAFIIVLIFIILLIIIVIIIIQVIILFIIFIIIIIILVIQKIIVKLFQLQFFWPRASQSFLFFCDPFETSKWLDPLLSAAPAFLLTELAPAVDFNIVAGLNYVCNITLRIYLLA